MIDRIHALRSEIEQYTIEDEDQLEQFRLEYLSRNGKIQSMFKEMGTVAPDERAQVGKLMNETKNLAQARFQDAKNMLDEQVADSFSTLEDISLPVQPSANGTLHPLSIVQREIKQIFYRLGFTIAHGPELEDDFHNFTALNFPPDHPARDMQDTFFVRKSNSEADLVLRTHTSPVQIRLLKEHKPPVRAIMPGRVFRNESVTAKSYFQFHQVEGLYVDKHVTMAALIDTLVKFVKMMYGEEVKYQVRPSFFPFTEPSIEMDIWWDHKDGGRWLEILGAGMVDPNVLRAVNIDPEEFSGFAFGMGVDRIALLRYGMDDIRTLYENDARFLEQFQ